MSARFELVGAETVYDGKIITVRRERYRYEDGGEAEREVVRHHGAVAVVAVDNGHVWLVRQPREAPGVPDLLELPAGKLDAAQDDPLETGRRELAEEIGKAAERWELLHEFFSTPGFTDEKVWVYLAEGLSDDRRETEEDERIEVLAWPLERLDEAIAQCRDSKSLVGLLALARRLQ